MRLAGIAEQELRPAFEQLVIDAVVDISGGADAQRDRLLSGTGAGDHNFILFQAARRRPARHFVADCELRVVAVRLFFIKGDLLDAGIRLLNVKVVFALLGHPRKGRRLVFCEVKRRVYEIGLVELRRNAVDLGAELSVHICFVGHHAGSEQRLAALPADHDKDLAENADAVFIDDPEDHREHRLLPERQHDDRRRELALVVTDELFKEPDDIVRLALVEDVLAGLDALHDALIQHPDPLADDLRAVADPLIVS